MDFTIRTAAASDVPAMHGIRTGVLENGLTNPETVTEASYAPYVSAGSAWVAETGDRVVGFAALDAKANSIWALFVDRNLEGVGIGRALHDRMLEWAGAHGLRQLSLSTSRRTRAERFYTAAGWLQVGFNAEGEAVFEKIIAA